MAASRGNIGSTQLLAPRTKIQVSHSTTLCPDLALIATATASYGWPWRLSTRAIIMPTRVIKKEVYEHVRVPRLWMVDPRYDNVEIYHSTEFGLVLKGILAGSEILSEKLVPEFQFVIANFLPPVEFNHVGIFHATAAENIQRGTNRQVNLPLP